MAKRKKRGNAGPRAESREGRSFSDFSDLFGMGAPVASGQLVTPETAMRFSAVFACVRLLDGAVAAAPAARRCCR